MKNNQYRVDSILCQELLTTQNFFISTSMNSDYHHLPFQYAELDAQYAELDANIRVQLSKIFMMITSEARQLGNEESQKEANELYSILTVFLIENEELDFPDANTHIQEWFDSMLTDGKNQMCDIASNLDDITNETSFDPSASSHDYSRSPSRSASSSDAGLDIPAGDAPFVHDISDIYIRDV